MFHLNNAIEVKDMEGFYCGQIGVSSQLHLFAWETNSFSIKFMSTWPSWCNVTGVPPQPRSQALENCLQHVASNNVGIWLPRHLKNSVVHDDLTGRECVPVSIIKSKHNILNKQTEWMSSFFNSGLKSCFFTTIKVYRRPFLNGPCVFIQDLPNKNSSNAVQPWCNTLWLNSWKLLKNHVEWFNSVFQMFFQMSFFFCRLTL